MYGFLLPYQIINYVMFVNVHKSKRPLKDTVSEWLRRWTRNPLGSARRGSNPLGVVKAIYITFNLSSFNPA